MSDFSVYPKPMTDSTTNTDSGAPPSAPSPPSAPTGYLVELISDRVHAAWMEQQRKDGNTSRISKGGEEMMVPYARLSESCKEYDRVTVRAVLDALDAIGYAVAPASEPTPDLAALLDDYELACYRHQSIPSLERHARVTTARATLDRSLAALSARVERDATDAERYRFLRDNPLQLRAIDGNAGWCGQILPYHFDAQTDATRGTP